MEKTVGNLKIKIHDTYEEMSAGAAEALARQLVEKPDSCLGFATGSTPVGMYRALVRLNKEGKIDFTKVRATFNLDEYYPIKKNDAQSYDYFMRDNLFDHIDIDQSVIHIPDGEAADPEAECAAYEQMIKDAGGLDFMILGIGGNGHIGFNEPGQSLKAETHCMALTRETIDANARFFNSPDLVPKNALTMGVGSIMAAKKIILLASSENKADIMRETVYGDITTQVPASILKLHRDVTIFADAAAAKYL